MRTIEDRVRAAYKLADDWGPQFPPPLAVPSRARGKWLVPLAAAAAVALVVLFLKSAPTTSSRPSATGSAGLMAYMAGGRIYTTHPTIALDRPANTKYTAITRGPTASTILAAEVTGVSSGFVSRIVQVQQKKKGKSAVNRTILPLTISGPIDDLALSPDGRRLAYSYHNLSYGGTLQPAPTVIGVVTMDASYKRTWTVPPGVDRFIAGISNDVPGLSWDGDATVMFTSRFGAPPPQVRAIDVDGPGWDLRKTRVVLASPGLNGFLAFGVSGGDGTLIAAVYVHQAQSLQLVIAYYRNGLLSRVSPPVFDCGDIVSLTKVSGAVVVSRQGVLPVRGTVCPGGNELYYIPDSHVKRIVSSNSDTIDSVA